MSDLTTTDLATLRRLLAAATPGPWTVERSRLDDDRSLALSAKTGDVYRWHELATVYCTGVEPGLGKPNAALIAALVNAALALIEMAERALPTCTQCGEPIDWGPEVLCPKCKEDGGDE